MYIENNEAAQPCNGIIAVGTSAIYFSTVLDETTNSSPTALAAGRLPVATRTLGSFPRQPEQIKSLEFSTIEPQVDFEMQAVITYKGRGYNPVAGTSGKAKRA